MKVRDTYTGQIVDIDLSHGDFFGRYERIKTNTLLVEYPIECPNCGRVLTKGDIIYHGEVTKCGYCREETKETKESREQKIKRLIEKKIGEGKFLDKYDFYIIVAEIINKIEIER